MEVFTPLSVLFERFGCRSHQPATTLLVMESAELSEVVREEDAPDILIGELFDQGYGRTEVAVTICTRQAAFPDTCNPNLPTVNSSVNISVQQSSARLLPYGDPVDDHSFRGVLDGGVPIYPPESIPFFSNYYNRLYVSC